MFHYRVLLTGIHLMQTGEVERLRGWLEQAHQLSALPEAGTGRPALNDLLLRLRLASGLVRH